MMFLVAWRILWHERLRTFLATSGIFVAFFLIFLQLGFYASVPEGGMTIYNGMRFDILMASSSYVYQLSSSSFPRRRLHQALGVPGVAAAVPVYKESAQWLNRQRAPGARGVSRDIFVMGFDPNELVLTDPAFIAQSALLRRPDTMLVDRSTRPEFGSLTTGRVVDLNDRAMTIAGTYALGTGFVGLGVAVVSDQNFIRLFPGRSAADVDLGLIALEPGEDPERVARAIRALMPADAIVLTRAELAERELDHWTRRTSTGLIFGFGAVLSVVIGTVILHQSVSTQVVRHLAEYATLKAIGYSSAYLDGIVVVLSLMATSAGFVPAFLAAGGAYGVIQSMTLLPVHMTGTRLAQVLALGLVMALGSAVLSMRRLHRADPAALF